MHAVSLKANEFLQQDYSLNQTSIIVMLSCEQSLLYVVTPRGIWNWNL